MEKNELLEKALAPEADAPLEAEKHRSKFSSLVSAAGQKTQRLVSKAAKAADQNEDGKLDLGDAMTIMTSAGSAAKRFMVSAGELASETGRQIEFKSLRPLFPAEICLDGGGLPRFIRIVDRDKKFAENELCAGSVGFRSSHGKTEMVNLFRDSVQEMGLRFYPDADEEFYFVDPSDPKFYLALEKYFDYLKIAQVNELQKIAQELGAKHFQVTFKEEQSSLLKEKARAQGKLTKSSGAEVEHDRGQKQYAITEIVAKMDFPGHAPVEPQLRYLRNDQSIQTLISLRMNAQSPLLHQTLMLKMSNSSGLKESEAARIDAILKGLKCAGNVTVVSEVQNESRRYLEYDIEF